MERKVYSRILSLIIALALACTVFTGCSEKKLDSTASASDTVQSSNNDDDDDDADLRYVTLSGKYEDSFVAERDIYTEGEEVVIFFQKGVTVRGDMLAVAEKVMKDLSELSGLTFEKKYTNEGTPNYLDQYFEKGVFDGVNKGHEKIYLMVVDLGSEYVEYADYDYAVLETDDFDFSINSHAALYHELSHVLHMRNGPTLGDIMTEGYATYMAHQASRMNKYADWQTMQYFYPNEFDGSVVELGEAGFKFASDDRDLPYQYGFRFTLFLHDTYGKDVFVKILKEAKAKGFASSYTSEDAEEDFASKTQALKEIIKSQTESDVFAKFAKWYKANWEEKKDEYRAYMKSVGCEF